MEPHLISADGSTDGPRAIEPALERVLDAVDLLPAKLLWTCVGVARGAGRLELAGALLDAIEARRGVSATLLEERARVAYAAGDGESALELLEQRRRQWPSATATVAVARLLLEMGRVDDAAELCDGLFRQHHALVSVKQLAAEMALAAGDFEHARSHYLALVDDQPEHPTALLALAKLSLREGDREAAAAFWRRAIAGSQPMSAGQLTTAVVVATELGEAQRSAEFSAQAEALHRERRLAVAQEVERALGESAPAPRPMQATDADRPGKSSASARLIASPVAEHAEAIHKSDHAVPVDPDVLRILREAFGHERLRPGQAAVIANVLAGRNTLAIMPTGAGKSLTFQLPALLTEGTTVVISPLIALMRDQVESLPERVRVETAVINSSVEREELQERLGRLARAELKLVYVAPERLRNYAFLRALREAGVSRVVVDEAHCISLWGHDFRPDYHFIPRALAELGDPPLLAITATATPEMVEQIGRGLGRQLDVVRTSIFRPNLKYEVHRLDNKEAKLERVVDICRRETGAGIVYVSSRRDAESIADLLRVRGVHALPYHAGLDPSVRSANQDRFMSGRTRVVVATVAFGMGVNKADVRFIVHLAPPRSLEAYAQESGRAGRDGHPARCILLVSPHDRNQLVAAARRDEIDLATLRRHYRSLQQHAAGRWVVLDPSLLRAADGDEESGADPRVALGILEQAGLIRRHPDAPAGYEIRRLGDPTAEPEDASLRAMWQAIEPALPESWPTCGACSVVTAALSDRTGITPVEIDRVFQAHPSLSTREGQRCICLHLSEVDAEAAATLQAILDQARQADQRRIGQVMAYANGNTCRHASLAAHLGEKLSPCRTACDVCCREPGAAAAPEPATKTRSLTRAQDAQAVLEAVRTLPFPMGKTGIARLLLGSIESRVRPDRSKSFGALGDLTKTRVESLIDTLIERGFLYRDLDHEFKLISLTAQGAKATIADLAEFEQQGARRQEPREESDLDAGSARLYERLAAWRKAKAVEEALPAYVVANNSTLRNIAVAKPQSTSALLAVPGFGPKGVEKYGAELLTLIASVGNGR
jgi:ATP-dependent DNA helicase RecQ